MAILHAGSSPFSTHNAGRYVGVHCLHIPCFMCSPVRLHQAGGEGFSCILQLCVKLQAAIKSLLSSSPERLALCQGWEYVSDCPWLTVPLAPLDPSVTAWGVGRACVTVWWGSFTLLMQKEQKYCSARKHSGKRKAKKQISVGKNWLFF